MLKESVRATNIVRTMEAELMPFTNADSSDGGAMWVRGAPRSPQK